MPLIQILLTLIVVGVLLWLVNLIPMQGTIKSILNSVVVIFVVIWLLNVFGLMPYLSSDTRREYAPLTAGFPWHSHAPRLRNRRLPARVSATPRP